MKRKYVLASAAIALCACEGQPIRMEVTGGTDTLNFFANDEQTLRVNVFNARGEKIEKPALEWSSMSPRIAKVTDDGMIIPGADGRTRITVRAGYVEQEIPVNVRIHAGIEILPNVLFLNAGDVRALTARVLDRQQRTVEGALISWTVADPKIAEVDERGTLSGVAPGKTTLTVEPAGASIELPVEIGATLEDAS